MIVDGVFTVGHYLWYALPLLSLFLIEHGQQRWGSPKDELCLRSLLFITLEKHFLCFFQLLLFHLENIKYKSNKFCIIYLYICLILHAKIEIKVLF